MSKVNKTKSVDMNDDVKFSIGELEEVAKSLLTDIGCMTDTTFTSISDTVLQCFIRTLKIKEGEVKLQSQRYEMYLALKQEFETTDEQTQPTPPIALVVNPTQNKPYMYPDKDGWYTVPSGWDKGYCPLGLTETEIEVKHRNGRSCTQKADYWYEAWVQGDDQYDIVKFRIVD